MLPPTVQSSDRTASWSFLLGGEGVRILGRSLCASNPDKGLCSHRLPRSIPIHGPFWDHLPWA